MIIPSVYFLNSFSHHKSLKIIDCFKDLLNSTWKYKINGGIKKNMGIR